MLCLFATISHCPKPTIKITKAALQATEKLQIATLLDASESYYTSILKKLSLQDLKGVLSIIKRDKAQAIKKESSILNKTDEFKSLEEHKEALEIPQKIIKMSNALIQIIRPVLKKKKKQEPRVIPYFRSKSRL